VKSNEQSQLNKEEVKKEIGQAINNEKLEEGDKVRERDIKPDDISQKEKKLVSKIINEETSKNQFQAAKAIEEVKKIEEKKEIAANSKGEKNKRDEKKFEHEEFGEMVSDSKRSIDPLKKEVKNEESTKRNNVGSKNIKVEKEISIEQFGSELSIKNKEKEIIKNENKDLLDKEKNDILEAEKNLDKFLEEERHSPLWSDKKRNEEKKEENSYDK